MKYPLGIQTFSQIREKNYLYVDKTDLVYQLIESGKVYFLSRPRRFGKSLLISTFESLFLAQKSLFDGLLISQTDYDFIEYPVVGLEFSLVDVNRAEDLKNYIINASNEFGENYDIQLTIDSYEQRFAELIKKLYKKTGRPVALLVDEYDKPILDNLFNQQLPEIKNALRSFYSTIKALDKFLHFVFITGVSKFAKVSVFSGMNSLTDISMDKRYATLCGITEQELDQHFSLAITELANLEQLSTDQMKAKIKHWYNGYYFEENATSVYNPYSLLSLFSQHKFNNYWFTTATPTFLLDLLQKQQFELKNLTEFVVGEASFAASEPETMDPLTLFLQTGYLTIKSYQDFAYSLDFPNYEVKKSFYDSVIGRYANIGTGVGQGFTIQLTKQLMAGDITGFFDTLKVFFANIPYEITLQQEKYYQSLFYALITLLGLKVEIDAEVSTNQGRIDCVLQTPNSIYIIEFKLNGSKEEALQQIIDKQYEQKYQASDKQIILLGVEFDPQSRNIGDFVQLTR